MGDDRGREPSAAFYEGVGRVAVAAGQLDLILAQLVALLRSRELPGAGGSRDWVTILSGKIGTPRKHFTQVASRLAGRPWAAALLSLHLDVEEALDARDRLIHSFHMTTVDEAGNPAALHARSVSEVALPTPAELEELHGRLRSLTDRALAMLLEHQAPRPEPSRLEAVRESGG